MKILKIFNNNSVAAISDDNRDVIVTGSGVGFKKKVGDLVDKHKIERTYELQNENNRRFKELLKQVPTLYFEITEKIVEKASKELAVQFDGAIFISISDHISFAMARKKEGIYLPNIILNETKVLYKKEYNIGLWALKYIRSRTGIMLEEDEAGYIALHLVNFSLQQNANNATKIATLTKEVLEVIRLVMKVNLREDSISYARVCTHLKYLAEKIFNGSMDMNDTTSDIRQTLKDDVRLNLCINRITKTINERYEYVLSPDEKTYLALHIKRVLQ